MSTEEKHPRVGMGLIVVRPEDRKVLVGKRLSPLAKGLVSFPGGHLDWGETWENCVLRELREECGDLLIVRVRRYDETREEWIVTNDIMPAYDKHYITVFMVADWVAGTPQNMEPEKCEGWEWYSYDQLDQLEQHGKLANWIPMKQIRALRELIGI